MFFYVQNAFPTFGKVALKVNRPIVVQIGEFIEKLCDNFELVMTSYFKDFKQSMRKILRILVSLVEKHFDDVFFLVDTDFTYVQETIPRVRWLRPL